MTRTVPMYMCVHEAAHAVIALQFGGFAELIDMNPCGARQAGCTISWPEDGKDRSREMLVTLAAGPAATAIYKRCSQDQAIFETGLGDFRRMKDLGADGLAEWFREARALCRHRWPDILNLARRTQHAVVLTESEINEALGVPNAD